MIGEDRQLVTDLPVEFEEKPVEVKTDHFRRIYRIPQFKERKLEDVNM